MRILITGCNGQLGNEMQLLEAVNGQHTYFNTDVTEDCPKVMNYHRLDITDKDAISAFVSENSIDGIVNCAAYTAVDKAEDNEDLCRLLNATAPAFLAEAIEKCGGWMVQVSTDYVFDGTGHVPYTEEMPICPNSVYGRTKAEGEQAVMNNCRRTMIIRTAWLYSTFGNNFVKTMIRLGNERDKLGVVFDQIGTPTYAADLAQAIMTAVNKGITPGIYHYSNEGVTSWYDFTKAIHRIAGIKTCSVSPLHTDEYPAKAPRPAYSVLDKTKIKTTYGITIPHWEEALAVCISKL